jgi:uncharacterized protein (DUF1800 family)
MSSLHPLLEPYTPTDGDPFDSVKAAHLLNRAGFGGTEKEIENIRSIGPEAALDQMMDFPDAAAEEQSQTDVPDLSAIDGIPNSFQEFYRQLRNKSEADKKELRQRFNTANQEVLMAMSHWWMQRMAYGAYPMQEKLTLFWHGHFTSSARDERASSLMWKQNELLRRYAAGNFGKVLHAISRDAAMLDYLNNTQNRKEHPNENYARELMELFALGIGHYTETDVKQGARAFTGWSHDGDDFVFNRNEHDYGIKNYLGYIGNFNGDDVVDIILRQPNCAPFIATELYRYFVSDNVDAPLSQALGQLFVQNDYELRPLLRTLLSSKAFYSSDTIGAQIKSPIQLVAGTVRLLGVDMPPQRALMASLTQMGQVPFMPPNVRGWLGGRVWINTSTVFVRYNTGVWLTGGPGPGFVQGRLSGKNGFRIVSRNEGGGVSFEPINDEAASAEDLVDKWVARLVQRPIGDSQKQILLNAVADGYDDPRAVRRLVQLIVSTPEYQLC